ncbi:ankyrin repeat domain-containing protein 45 isoform X2 [Betta splendens]|uniref:Ankyrin repeat domain-containing protein 45 isoform X2 n=1 Tax=Betta splendens TaxID=158456 RepID=A0A6P7KY32_BETSP|nr:ankyrin repeat domain-containing protein 45 isoform X2 [Betta splendens]
MIFVSSGDLEAIVHNLESEYDREEILDKKDEVGRKVLAVAAMLGRSAIVRELVRHGAQVNEQTVRGYSSLHFAACWGHVDTVRTLLELGASTETWTFRRERPVDLARKYSKADCVDCLALAGAKQDLVSYIAFIKDMVSESAGQITTVEKNLCVELCAAKSDWIQSFKNPTVLHFTAQRKEIEDKLQSILNKLSAQSANPSSG